MSIGRSNGAPSISSVTSPVQSPLGNSQVKIVALEQSEQMPSRANLPAMPSVFQNTAALSILQGSSQKISSTPQEAEIAVSQDLVTQEDPFSLTPYEMKQRHLYAMPLKGLQGRIQKAKYSIQALKREKILLERKKNQIERKKTNEEAKPTPNQQKLTNVIQGLAGVNRVIEMKQATISKEAVMLNRMQIELDSISSTLQRMEQQRMQHLVEHWEETASVIQSQMRALSCQICELKKFSSPDIVVAKKEVDYRHDRLEKIKRKIRQKEFVNGRVSIFDRRKLARKKDKYEVAVLRSQNLTSPINSKIDELEKELTKLIGRTVELERHILSGRSMLHTSTVVQYSSITIAAPSSNRSLKATPTAISSPVVEELAQAVSSEGAAQNDTKLKFTCTANDVTSTASRLDRLTINRQNEFELNRGKSS